MTQIEAELELSGAAGLSPVPNQPGPFQVTAVSSWIRLDWAGGHAAVSSSVGFWGCRYAVALLWKGEGLAVIDATDPVHHVVVDIPLPTATSLVVADGRVRIRIDNGILSIPCRALEQLPIGPAEIVANVSYPLRNVSARLSTKLSWIYDNGDAIANVGRARVFFDTRAFGLTKDVPFVLCDELWPNTFGAIEVAGQPLRELRPIETVRTYAGTVSAGLPPHPLRMSIQPPTLRTSRFTSLLEHLADHPNDDASRDVLLDLLQDEGAPYAEELAGARAARRIDTSHIGPLSLVFDRVQYRDGLPWFAHVSSLVAQDDVIALVGEDIRTGLLTTIVRGNASITNYIRVLAMPLAISLRCVDSCSREVLAALIEHRRDRLTSLGTVQLTKSHVRALLADPTFDRVTEIEARISSTALRDVLTEVARDTSGAYARAPRRLTLLRENGQYLDEIGPVLAAWDDLPVAAIRASWCELERRDGTTHVEILRGAPPEIAAQIRRKFPG